MAARVPADQQDIRRANLALVLREIVSAPAPIARAEVASSTGLTRATVSTLVEWLLDRGLVRELPPGTTAKAGRPSVPLAPSADRVIAIGAEINVDYLAARVVDLTGAVLAERVEHGDFRSSEPGPVLDRMARLADQTAAACGARGRRLIGGGLAVAGLVDAGSGALRIAPNLGWRDLDLGAELRRRCEHVASRVSIGNEADFAAAAEAEARRVRGPASFLYVSGEIGIGAAIVLDGRVLRGRHGWSGELGHTVLGTTGSLRSGGTLERYAGKDAILRSAGLPLTTSLAALAEAAAAGRPRVAQAVSRAGAALGVALANAGNLLDVEHVVLGGAYAELAPALREPVLEQLRARLIGAPWAEPAVHVAIAGTYPAVTGAALATVNALIADPLGWDAGRLTTPA